MCLLVVKPKGVHIEEAYDVEDLCYEATAANPHGWGISWRDDHGKIQIYKGMIHPKVQAEILSALGDREAIIHWRYATGGTPGQFNCHPFQIKDESGNDNGAFAHNGVMPIISRSVMVMEKVVDKDGKPLLDADQNERWEEVEKKLSDTHTVAFCGRSIDAIEAWLKANPEVMVGSKFALMDPLDGIRILNDKDGTWMDGTWFSNTHWKNRHSSLRVAIAHDQGKKFNILKKHTAEEWMFWMVEAFGLGEVTKLLNEMCGGNPLMEFPLKRQCDPCSDLALTKDYEDELEMLMREGL